jgi:hypothetical protein
MFSLSFKYNNFVSFENPLISQKTIVIIFLQVSVVCVTILLSCLILLLNDWDFELDMIIHFDYILILNNIDVGLH